MNIKTSELTGKALDWAVDKAEGRYCLYPYAPYSTDWSQGGPIIEREEIDVQSVGERYWRCKKSNGTHISGHGPTPLIAAMRCYVASKLGDTVDIPEELV